MARRLSLDALGTFEAVARHGSLTGAARELNLTDSAVSHQLRKLRERLGFDLFHRHGRSVRLSQEGAALLATLRPALHGIEEMAARLKDADGTSGPITIACASMFASRVLSRTIGGFAEKHPRIPCRIRSMENDQVLEIEDMDVGVLFGAGGWPGFLEARIAAVRYAPVCGPRLLKRPTGAPPTPSDLLDHVIIHIDQGADWRRWLDEAGVAARAIPRELFTNDVGVALEIARDCGGITLASDLLASADVATGALVRPFDRWIGVEGAWFLICPRERARIPRVQMFVAWLSRALDFPRPDFL